MSTIALWWLIAFLGVCALLGLLAERRRVGKKLARFQDRENLALDEIYRRYYVNSGLPQNSVLNVWRDLAKNLGVAPSLS